MTKSVRSSEFFERSTAPVVLLNRQWRVVFANRAWESTTGVSSTTIIGSSCKSPAKTGETPISWSNILAPPSEAKKGQVATRTRLVPDNLFADEHALPQWWQLIFVPFPAVDATAGVLVVISPMSHVGVFEDPPLPQSLVHARDQVIHQYTFDSIPSNAPKMRRVVQQLRLATEMNCPVLFVGKYGTGKQWLARTLHAQSKMTQGCFIHVDCSRLPAAAVAALALGHHGTVQRVRPCTLHLHRPECLPRELQSRLVQDESLWSTEQSQLRVTASMQDAPHNAVETRNLLPELYCLLSPFTIDIPPLREHRNDIPFYAVRMLLRINEAVGSSVHHLSIEAFDALQKHDWPGNLHELLQVLTESCRRANAEEIRRADLPFYVRGETSSEKQSLDLDRILETVERRLIQLALNDAKNNKKRAAEILGIWRPRLLRRITNLGLEND